MSAPLKSGKSIGGEQMTAEGTFIWMYIDAMSEFRHIWLEPKNGQIDERAFMLQVRFLINAIPNKQIRDGIWKKLNDKEEALKNDPLFPSDQKDFAKFHASVEVISDIVEFLCSAFQLTHSDIWGPATSNQFKDNRIIIPDMPTENPEVSDAKPAMQ